MMKKEWILLCMFFLCIGCTEEKEQQEVVNLQHEVLDWPDMLIGAPGDILKKNDCLIVLDYKQDSLFHRIDLEKNSYMGMFGPKGQGPSEFNHPSSLSKLPNGRLACYDLMKNELSMMNLGMDGNEVEVSRLYRNNSFMTFNIVPLSEDHYIVNGETDGAMFALIDKEGAVLSTSDEYPYKDEEEKRIPSRYRAMAYQGTLRVHTNGCFAYVMRSAKQLHLYKVEDFRLKKIAEIIDGYAHYKPDMSHPGGYAAAHDSNYPECYLDLAVTDNHVYALYSGRTYKEYKMAAFEGETIYVYDWAGRLLKTCQLDVAITRFCVDEDKDVVYAVANIPEPTIVRFALK